jgi:hypothetical protein
MKTSPFQMPGRGRGRPKNKVLPPTREMDSPRGTAIHGVSPLPAAATSGKWRFSLLPDMTCHGKRLVSLELQLQDARADARREQDARGVWGLARLFSAASVRALRIEIAMILHGYLPPRRSIHPRPRLLDWPVSYLFPPRPESPCIPKRASGPHSNNGSRKPADSKLPLW